MCLARGPNRDGLPATPVVEAGADGDQEIAVFDGVICRRHAVHTQHMQRERMFRVAGAERHQRRRDRDAVFIGKTPHCLAGVGVDDASAGINQRPFRFGKHRVKALAGLVRQAVLGDGGQPPPVAVQRQGAFSLERPLPVLYVLRDIDDHRARPPGTGEFEGAADRRLELLGIGDEENVFGDGAHDGGNRRFLEGVGADGGRRDLSADDDQRDRIRHAVADRRDGIGCAGPGRHHDDADPPTRPGVTGRHESGALLIGGDDEAHSRSIFFLLTVVVVAEHGVVNRQYRAAAIAEDRIDAFVREHLDYSFRTAHGLPGERVLVCL